MFGRASLFLVLGFSVLFTVYTVNILFTTTRTVDYYAQYYNQTKASEVAQSGATMACNAFFLTQSSSSQWSAGYSNVTFDGGTINVGVTFPGSGIVQVTSVGSYGNVSDTVQIKLRPSNFAKFGNFYSNVGNVYFATGDTADGPIHFNTTCNVIGNPVFLGKVTCLNGINYGASGSNPKFLGGFQSGVSVSLNNTATNLASASGPSSGGVVIGGRGSKPYVNVDMTFNSDGSVTYKMQTNSSNNFGSVAWSTPVTTPLSTLAPNGVILIKQGNVTTRGTVKGNITLAAVSNGASGLGNIYLDNNLVYNTNPKTNPASTDMLGLVAENNIQLNYNSSFGDVNVMASMLCQNGGLVIQNYSSYPSIHNFKLYGGLSAATLNATSDPSITHGFRYNQTYDKRLYDQFPPYFPMTGTYEIISWLE
jgi:hypothetical protein